MYLTRTYWLGKVSDVDFGNVVLILFADVVLGLYHTDPWSLSLRPEGRHYTVDGYILHYRSLMLLTPDVGVGVHILHIPVLVNVSIPGFVG